MILQQRGLCYDDVLLIPAYTGSSSRSEVDTTTKLGPFSFKTPLVSANMESITGVAMARVMAQLGGLGILHRFCSIEENVQMYKEASKGGLLVGVSVGVGKEALNERLPALVEAGARLVCLDVAHAHSKLMSKMLKNVRDKYGDSLFIISGNIATYAGADSLVGWGADAVKCGTGSGSVCTTRMKTGCGVPQLTAIMDCHRVRKPIIADGGIRSPADFCKALAAGASMVMVGGMFSGTNETPGKEFIEPGVGLCKVYRGLASKEAQEDFMGQVSDWKTAEGISVSVPCKGPVEAVIKDLMGGLRSCMTYCGSTNLEELRSRAQFMEITSASYVEGTPHIQRALHA